MPVYEYKCEKCGAKFEILRGITAENEEVKCPRCSTEKPKRLFSTVCGASHGSNKGNLRFPT
jgi:putative FmdB family regulatory protein